MRFWIHLLLVLAWLLPAGMARAQGPALGDWRAEQADELVFTLRALVDELGGDATAVDQRQVALAAAEALRRFPQAGQRAAWQWEQAYSLNLAGDPQACTLYAGLLQQELSAQRVPPEQFSDWLSTQEPRMALNGTPFEASSGFRGAYYLLELAGMDMPNLYFIAQVQPGGGYRVGSMCEGRALGVRRSVYSEWNLSDLTGDGRAEFIVADFSDRGRRFDVNAYNLAIQPTQWLDVPVPAGFANGRWIVQPPQAQPALSGQVRPSIEVEGIQALEGGCPLVVLERYAWNGLQMQTIHAQVVLDAVKGDAMCAQDLFDQSLNRLAGGDFGALDTARALLDAWPAACSKGQAHPFSLSGCPADVRDEARFRIALSIAQAGNVNLARQEMNAIARQPSIEGSTWVQPASAFGRAFVSPQSLARACQASGRCYPYLNLRLVLRQTSTAYRSQLFSMLQTYGVPVLASGMTDVDANRLNEHWFTVPTRDPSCGEQCPPELWLVVQSNRRFWSYALGPLLGGSAVNFQALPSIDGMPVFTVTGQLEQPQALVRSRETGRVEILPVCEVFQTRLDEAERVVLGNGQPAALQAANRSLSAWTAADLSACPIEQLWVELPRLKYLKALSFELLGDPSRAAAAYQALMEEEPGSMLAFLAESRLNAQ